MIPTNIEIIKRLILENYTSTTNNINEAEIIINLIEEEIKNISETQDYSVVRLLKENKITNPVLRDILTTKQLRVVIVCHGGLIKDIFKNLGQAVIEPNNNALFELVPPSNILMCHLLAHLITIDTFDDLIYGLRLVPIFNERLDFISASDYYTEI